VLVKDIAFRAQKIGNHDYLMLPEIVEDICNGYRDKYSISIREDVVSSLKPCIVKFRSKFRIDQSCIGVAILYVYKLTKGEPLSPDASTCFDAKGNVIPHGDILSIKYL
jgi:hypothetical protein